MVRLLPRSPRVPCRLWDQSFWIGHWQELWYLVSVLMSFSFVSPPSSRVSAFVQSNSRGDLAGTTGKLTVSRSCWGQGYDRQFVDASGRTTILRKKLTPR